MKKLLLLFYTLLLFTACHDNDPEVPAPPSQASRTVIVYMSGENNLTATNSGRFLSRDLQEMQNGSKLLTDNQRLFVFVDSLNSSTTGTPFIAELHGGKMYKRYEFDHDFYASDPAYFQQVLQWVINYAPADDYGLVLWGHASGWIVSNDTIAEVKARISTRAYGQDDGTDIKSGTLQRIKWMNITQMAHALQPLPKFRYIFADCCNMMCAEVAYELRNETEFLIGSPAEIPGNGAPYHKMMPYLFSKDPEFYKGIVDCYYENYLQENRQYNDLNGYSLPISVIDNKFIEPLGHATHDIIATFVHPDMRQMVKDSIVFYFYYEPEARLMFDMKQYLKKNAPASAYDQWLPVFKQAVPYQRISLRWMTAYDLMDASFDGFVRDESLCGGVSMFIPMKYIYAYESGRNYNEYSKKMSWNSVVDWSRF